MKYLWHWEWKMEDWDEEQMLSQKMEKAIKENPGQFPKMLTPTCFTGKCKGFRIIEADNDEQLANLVLLWWPTEDWWLEPFLEANEKFTKAWQKWNPANK